MTTLSGSAVPQPVIRALDDVTAPIMQDGPGAMARCTRCSRSAQPRHRLAAGEALAGDGQQPLHGAAERRADLVAGHVADDAAALDVLALGDVGGRARTLRPPG